MPRGLGSLGFALFLALGSCSAARAQTVGGEIRTTDGQPLPGAVVQVLGSDSAVVASAVSNPSGYYHLRLPGPGEWQFLISFLGYVEVSEVVAVESAATDQSFVMEAVPISLDGLDVSAESQCPAESRDPRVGQLLLGARDVFGSALHPQARLLLEISTVFRDLHLALQPFPPDSAPRVDTLWIESTAFSDQGVLDGPGEIEFASEVLPGVENAYLYDRVVLTPQILFSQQFMSSHCFSLDGESEAAWVGLRFEPKSGSSVEHDVRGTFWIPSEDSSQPRIEYQLAPYPRQNELWVEGGDLVRSTWVFPADVHRVLGSSVELVFAPGVGWIPSRVREVWPEVSRVPKYVAQSEVRDRMLRGDPLSEILKTTPRGQVGGMREVWYVGRLAEISTTVVAVQMEQGGG